uniref:HnRNP-R, Q splicing factor family n=1 Tax=Panagrellus redivivus TaxID=6233 RepID=A0A7E4UMD1_PANRE
MEEVPPVDPESQGPEGDASVAAADIKAEIKPEVVKEEPATATNGAEEPAPVVENGSAEAAPTDATVEVKPEAEEKPAEEAAPAAEGAAEPAAEGQAEAEQSNGDAAPSNGDGEATEVFADDKQSMVNSFIEKKLSKKVAARLADVILSLGLNRDDFDDRAIDLLSTFNLESSLFIIKEIEESQLYGVQNRPQYLMAIMRNFKERYRSLGQHSTGVPLIPGPKIETIKSIIDRTHYHLEITVGQRKYHCPPELVNEPTGTDHEVFIGQIPRDVYEDQLIPIFEEVGQIYDLRIMMDPPNGKSRGYAFLVYVNRDHAFEAAKKFNGYEIVPGKPLKVNISVANTRLFIGNIPKSKTKEEILEELKKHAVSEGVLDVIVYTNPDAADNKKNRGFCFVDFAEHKAASDAKRRIGTGKVRPWNSDLVVDWADQQEEPDEETMSQVKVLYVKNLKEAVTEDKLTEMFKPYGEIERVKKIRDYAFIHYKNREDALKAMEEMKGKVIEGVDVEISLAKPQGESKLRRGKGPTPNAKRANAIIARANARAAAHNTTYNEYYGPPSRGAPRGGAVPGYGARYPPYAPPAPYGGGYNAYDGGYGGAYPMASPYSGYDPYGGYPADPYYGTPYAGPNRGLSSGSESEF